MIDYKEIWNSINLESEKSIFDKEIVRRIPANDFYSVFVATDFKNGLRLLYCKLNDLEVLNFESFPKFKGLEISKIVTNIGEFRNEEFLRIKQSIPNTDSAFESVISDICQNIVLIEQEGLLNAVLIKVLSEWRAFFELDYDSILSPSRQKGLYGELFFLKEYLFQRFPLDSAMLLWTGSDMSNHDFQINDVAVEVKTTSAKQHRVCKINCVKAVIH